MAISAPNPRSALNAALRPNGIEIKGRVTEEYATVLTSQALAFLAKLARRFEGRRQELLACRVQRQNEFDDGKWPDFLRETREIREGNWHIASIPDETLDRRVEITGPVERKMIINALNSGANVYMADFEDSNSPTWANNLEGQTNLRDAVQRVITYTSAEGKHYELQDSIATLFVRPRGWHLVEKHMHIDGKPISASLFDFGLFFFHNATTQLANGTRPYFYLAKLESHLEARLWNDVFNFAQDQFGIPRGTIRATVLIETIPAAFEMDEILYELRDHSAGLNCGRWDYIFSFIKKFRNRADYVLPDRAQVSMDRHFLNSYVRLLIKTCHRRGAHAMGGMAAQIPIKNDPVANEQALEKVRQDKLREVREGHDGTWVAHPGLLSVAQTVFDSNMSGLNQIDRMREDVHITANDLLEVPTGDITEQGLRQNIDVGVQYLESWLSGQGCVPIYNLMEDAATAEISRSQVWQWIRHGAKLNDGRVVTGKLVKVFLAEELEKLEQTLGPAKHGAGRFDLASELFEEIVTTTEFTEFLIPVAYNYLD